MKKALFIFSLLFFNQPGFSQAPVIEWQNTIGGSLSDELYSMAKTTDGGYICGGSSSSDSSGDKTENSRGGFDYWIVKLDGWGKIQWQHTVGGSGDDILFAITQTTDGGYICGGKSSSGISGDKTENCIGVVDYWIVKLDSSGNIEWQNTIGGSGVEIFGSISQTFDGGFICIGHSNSNISGDKSENSVGWIDYWVIKLDQLGNIVWQNTLGGYDADQLPSICQTFDGGYICGGNSSSNISGDKSENNIGSMDYWILKLDSAGNIQWQNTIGGSGDETFTCISQTTDGGYICGGSSYSYISGDKTEDNIGIYDYWVIKLDSFGDIQWQNTIGGTSDDRLLYLKQTTDCGFICVGNSNSNISGDKLNDTIGGFDCWIIKLNSVGNIQWQNTIGGSGAEQPNSISQSDDGGYIFGGYSNSNISGDKTENCIGGYDYWVVKLTSNYNIISGKLFIDLNSNAVQDIGELSIQNSKVLEMNSGRYCFSDMNGIYSAGVLDSGNYTVSTYPLIYYNPTPASYNTFFSGLQQTDSLNNFAFQPTGVYNDLRIKLTPLGPFRPGQNAFYRLDYQNVGTTTLTGDVVFYVDTTLNYISSTSTPASISSDSIVWNTGLLSPFQSGSVTITVHVKQTILAGTLIHSFSKIFPISTDDAPQNNVSSWEVTVTGSYDPNDILVSRSEILTTELPNPPWLEYIIRFQNSGNDTAFMVKVFNAIDTNRLDLNSFEFEASSHPVNINYNFFARRFEFSFPGILLPDSNINELASHGFIRYRIKPLSTLVLNDSIKNKALIFFDFNAAVETNTAITKIVLPTGISSQSQSNGHGLKLFPNPASGTITVQLTNPKETIREIKIIDLLGRAIFENQLKTKNYKPETDIDISGFQKGIYIIEVSTGKSTYRGRVIKQ